MADLTLQGAADELALLCPAAGLPRHCGPASGPGRCSSTAPTGPSSSLDLPAERALVTPKEHPGEITPTSEHAVP